VLSAKGSLELEHVAFDLLQLLLDRMELLLECRDLGL
jgi:hypothetical protein